MKLRALAPAEAEITQAHDYLEAKLPSLGGRFLDDLTATLSEISRQPLRFQKLETLRQINRIAGRSSRYFAMR